LSRGTRVLALGCAAVAGYAVWSRSGRVRPGEVGPLYIEGRAADGEDRGAGNLLGVQPYMVPYDYASRGTFHAKLDGYLAEARTRGWLTPKTVAVFPEFIGTWLVLEGEKQDAFAASTSAQALRQVVLANLQAFVLHVVRAPAKAAVKHSLVRMKAAAMAAAYHDTFSRLARHYGITIVAGSILLPAAEVAGSALRIHDGPLYNVCVVYRPEGTPHEPIVRKAYPTPE